MAASTKDYPPGYLDEFCGDRLVVVTSVFIAAEIVFVALSFVATHVSQRSFRREEWLTILVLACNLAMNAISLGMSNFSSNSYPVWKILIPSSRDFELQNNLFIIAGVKYVYAGYHLSYVVNSHPAKLAIFLKMEITFATLYFLSITLPKLTMLSLFLRIFVVKWQRIASYTIGAILLATALANIIANVTQCVPLEYLWNKEVAGKCFDQNAYWRWASLPNILTDVVMLGLPVPAIWGAQMGWKDKLGVGLTFFAGSLYVSAANFILDTHCVKTLIDV